MLNATPSLRRHLTPPCWCIDVWGCDVAARTVDVMMSLREHLMSLRGRLISLRGRLMSWCRYENVWYHDVVVRTFDVMSLREHFMSLWGRLMSWCRCENVWCRDVVVRTFDVLSLRTRLMSWCHCEDIWRAAIITGYLQTQHKTSRTKIKENSPVGGAKMLFRINSVQI